MTSQLLNHLNRKILGPVRNRRAPQVMQGAFGHTGPFEDDPKIACHIIVALAYRIPGPCSHALADQLHPRRGDKRIRMPWRTEQPDVVQDLPELTGHRHHPNLMVLGFPFHRLGRRLFGRDLNL